MMDIMLRVRIKRMGIEGDLFVGVEVGGKGFVMLLGEI